MRRMVLGFLACLLGAGPGAGDAQEPPRAPERPLSMRLGSPAFRHAAGVRVVAFSPDGKVLASGGEDAWVRLWEMPGGKELGSIRLDRPVSGLAFSGDGKTLSCAGSGSDIRILSVPSAKELRRLQIPLKRVRCLVSSRQGEVRAAAGESTILVWPAPEKDAPTPLAGHRGLVAALALSPDGKTLASGCATENAVLLWTPTSPGEPVTLDAGEFGGVTSLAFSPDGRTLAAGSGSSTVRTWDLAKRVVTSTTTVSGAVTSLAFSADGKALAAASGRGMLRVWESSTGTELCKVDSQCREIRSLAFSPDGGALVAATDQVALRRWNPSNGQDLDKPGDGHRGQVLALCASRSGLIASAAEDGSLCLWEASAGTLRWSRAAHPNPVHSVRFSEDGLILASAAADSVCLWNVDSGDLRKRIKDPLGGLVRAMTFLEPEKSLAVATTDNRIAVWDAATGDRTSTMAEREGVPTALVSSIPARVLAWSDHAGDIGVVDWGSEGKVQKMSAKGGPVTSLDFSPDAKTLASGEENGTIRIWTRASRSRCLDVASGQGNLRGLAHSPDGRLLASVGQDGTLKLWELASGKELCSLVHEDGPPTSVAFTLEGKGIASGTSRSTVIVRLLRDILKPSKPLPEEVLIRQLKGQDPREAFQAVEALVEQGERSVDALRPLLLPGTVDEERISGLLAKLDDDRPEARENAAAELQWIGPPARIQAALENKPGPEAKALLERILASMEEPPIRWPHGVFVLRSLQVLERIPSPKSEEALQQLARGTDARQSREARKALTRLKSAR